MTVLFFCMIIKQLCYKRSALGDVDPMKCCVTGEEWLVYQDAIWLFLGVALRADF